MSEEKANPGVNPAQAPLDRRTMLAAGGVVGASAALLAVAGCSSYSSNQQSAAPSAAAAPQQGAGTALGPASAVPVGGGVIYAAQKVVVTQPAAGQFHGFSAICTHQGCTLSSVSGGTINCPCHGSKFNISNGSVAHGPAQRPLPGRQVSDQGGQLRLT